MATPKSQYQLKLLRLIEDYMYRVITFIGRITSRIVTLKSFKYLDI